MYICNECHSVFNKPMRMHEDKTPYGGNAEPRFMDYYEVCPDCGADFSEAMPCQRCESRYVSVQIGYPFCAHCMSQLMKQYEQLIADNFREDEYDMLYDHMESMDPYKKGE